MAGSSTPSVILRHLLQHFFSHWLQLLASQLHQLLLRNFGDGLLLQDIWDLDRWRQVENVAKMMGDEPLVESGTMICL